MSTSSTGEWAQRQRRHRRHGPHRALPPAGRRRLGRLPLSLRLQCLGLRADHRSDPSATTGPPGLRGLELRHLQLRAAQGRLPPARDPGALLPPNVDSDEVMFYVDGDHEARKGPASPRARSHRTPAGTRTGPSPVPPRIRSAPSASRSWPSWSTPSSLSSWVRAAGPVTTVSTNGVGAAAESRTRGIQLGVSIAPVEQEVTESRVTSPDVPWITFGGTTRSTSCPM